MNIWSEWFFLISSIRNRFLASPTVYGSTTVRFFVTMEYFVLPVCGLLLFDHTHQSEVNTVEIWRQNIDKIGGSCPRWILPLRAAILPTSLAIIQTVRVNHSYNFTLRRGNPIFNFQWVIRTFRALEINPILEILTLFDISLSWRRTKVDIHPLSGWHLNLVYLPVVCFVNSTRIIYLLRLNNKLSRSMWILYIKWLIIDFVSHRKKKHFWPAH